MPLAGSSLPADSVVAMDPNQEAAIDLVEASYDLEIAPDDWLPNMLDANPFSGPGITWIGQFFVGIGFLIGSIDRAGRAR